MEREFHRWLRDTLPRSSHVLLPVGDDGSVLRWSGAGCVVTTDTISDEVDFRLAEATPQQVGHKALGINLSDLAAMAARPRGCVVALMLPRDNAAELARELITGMLPVAEEFGCPIVGGDVHVWDHPLAITVTVLGEVATEGTPQPQIDKHAKDTSSKDIADLPLCQPLRRDTAQAGDAIVVTGAFGGSILGRHLNVRPRIREALELCRRFDVHAGMDCSDGLTLDLARLAEASGLGIELRLDQIPIHEDARQLAARTGRTLESHALQDGEDFELLLAVSPADAAQICAHGQQTPWAGRQFAKLTEIGHFTSSPGFWGITEDGQRRELTPKGYQHG